MTRGMYAAAGAMLIGLDRNEVLSNNLANASTPGFKMDRVSYGSFQDLLLAGVTDENGEPARIKQSATLNESSIDLGHGNYVTTDNDLDLAVNGDSWFVVATPSGERYTRNGHFSRAADGTLTTAQGWPVLGEAGPIILPTGAVTVTSYGEILADGLAIGRLRTVQFANPQSVTKEGDSLYAGGEPVEVSASGIQQGTLETSNTDPMRVMVEMIATMRSYEMNQRVIAAQDRTLQSVIDVARR